MQYLNIDDPVKSPNLDGFVKSSNSRRANFVIMRRTYRTLNDCEMQHNAEVGLFTRPSILTKNILDIILVSIILISKIMVVLNDPF